MKKIIIEAASVTLKKGNKIILKACDFVASGSEVTAFSGPSGCGKTTLLRAIMGLDSIFTGTILINGLLPEQFVKREASDFFAFGYVPQDFSLWPHMKVIQNIAFVNGDEKTTQTLLEILELTDYVNSYPSQLSHGQKQRVAIIRALSIKPRILILDEATSALDKRMTKVVWDLLNEYKAHGCAILLVTHEHETLSRCDRIIRFEAADDCFSLA